MEKITHFFCIITLLISFTSLSGCEAELIGILADEEAVTASSIGLEATASRLVVQDEMLFSARLSEVRLFRPTVGRPVLYFSEQGAKNALAEVINPNTIRWIRTGREVVLPGRLYTIRNGVINVKLMTGPGGKYPVYSAISPNRLLIRLEESNGWYKVMLDNYKTIGWVSAASLAKAWKDSTTKLSTTAPLKKVSKLLICNACNGTGKYQCPKCAGLGSTFCLRCNQSGMADCTGCNGQGSVNCNSCEGTGKTDCISCVGKGRISCRMCFGSGQVQYLNRFYPCEFCKGNGSQVCRQCDGNGYTTCRACNGIRRYTCKVCNGKARLICPNCDGKKYISCTQCNGKNDSTCFYCSGAGRFYVVVNDYLSKLDCSKANTSQYLFYNRNPFPVKVLMYKVWYTGFRQLLYELYFYPMSAKCVYDQEACQYEFQVNTVYPTYETGDVIDRGSFSIEKCATTTYITRYRLDRVSDVLDLAPRE